MIRISKFRAGAAVAGVAVAALAFASFALSAPARAQAPAPVTSPSSAIPWPTGCGARCFVALEKTNVWLKK